MFLLPWHSDESHELFQYIILHYKVHIFMAVLHVIISIALSLFSPPPLFSTFSNFLKGNSFHLNFRFFDVLVDKLI